MVLKNVGYSCLPNYRKLALGVFLCGCVDAFPAVFLSEVSNQIDDSFVELFNSSDSIVSLKGWSLECGINHHSLEVNIVPDSVVVLRFDMPFLVGDSLVLRNEKAEIVDKINFKKVNDDSGEHKTTFQRDTIVLFHDEVLDEYSTFKKMKESEGDIPELFEQDRSTIVYSFDSENNVLIGNYRSREIKKVSARFDQDQTAGIGEIMVTVFPNPVKSILNVENTGIKDIEFNLQNISGQILQHGKLVNGTTQIDMNEYVSGVYLLVIENEKEQQIIKIEKR